MATNDIIIFMLWSVGLAAFDFTPWQIIACQTAWLAVLWAAKRIIDVRFEQRETE